MKRFLCLLLTVCLLITLGGCGSNAPHGKQMDEWSRDDEENAEILGKEIIRCLTDKDREGFVDLFCGNIQSQEEFSQQIDAVFALFDYTSYIRCQYNAMGSGRATEGGKETQRTLRGEIVYIEVLEIGEDGLPVSKYYGVEWFCVLTGSSSLEGIHQFTIQLLNTEKAATVGNLDAWPG